MTRRGVAANVVHHKARADGVRGRSMTVRTRSTWRFLSSGHFPSLGGRECSAQSTGTCRSGASSSQSICSTAWRYCWSTRPWRSPWSTVKDLMELDKNLMVASSADDVLLRLKKRFPDLS